MGNVSTNVYAKFRCAPLHIKRALGIFWTLREVIPRTRSRSQSSVLGPAFRVQKWHRFRWIIAAGHRFLTAGFFSSVLHLKKFKQNTFFGSDNIFFKTKSSGVETKLKFYISRCSSPWVQACRNACRLIPSGNFCTG